MVWALFLGAAKIILAEAAVLYTVLILSILRTEKTHYHLSIDPHHSARSALMLAIWLGLWTVPIILGPAKTCLDILEDTSADVGEWVLHYWNS
jgi:hypothetical protein